MQNHDHIRLTLIGGPTLLIEWAGVRLLTDPTFDPSGSQYATGAFTLFKTGGPAVEAAQIGSIDAVLLSHDHHFDNLDRAGRAFLPKCRQVITTIGGAQRLGKKSVGLAPWQQITIRGDAEANLSVIATPARHGPAGGDRGPVIGFVLQRKDRTGPAVYISGDTVFFDGVEETLQRFGNIRAAILFMGAARIPVLPSHITFTASEATSVADALPHAAIIPIHCEGWEHFTEARSDIDRTFAKTGIKDSLLWLTAGEPHELSLDDDV